MKLLYFLLIPVLISCSSPERSRLDQPLYRFPGSGTYLYFTGDSVQWIGNLYRDNTVRFPYKIRGNNLYLVYSHNRYDQLTIRKNELVFKSEENSFSRLAASGNKKEIELTGVPDREAAFLFERIKLLKEIRTTIISGLKHKVAHPENFRYHDLTLKSQHDALEKDIPDLEVSITWWNTLNSKEWQWNRNTYNIVVQGSKWQIVETESDPVNLGEVVHP